VEPIQGFTTGYRYRDKGFKCLIPVQICALLESVCWVASKGDSVLMRLRSRAEVERQLLNAYLAVFREKRRERERERGGKGGPDESPVCRQTGLQ